MKLPLCLSLILLTFLPSCKKAARQELEPPTISAIDTADEEDIKKWATQLAVALETRDIKAVEAVQDLRSLVEEGMHGLLVSPKEVEELHRGASAGINRNTGGLFQSLVGARTRFLGLKDFQGERVPLFSTSGENSMDYFFLKLNKISPNEYKIYDLLTLTQMTWVSSNLREAFAPGSTGMEGVSLEEVLRSPTAIALTKHQTEIRGFRGAYLNDDLEKAHQIYEDLPEIVQKNKGLWIMYVGSLYEKPTKQAEELGKLQKIHPETTKAHYLLLDVAMAAEDYEQAEHYLEKTIELVGHEELSQTIKASIYWGQGRLKEAATITAAVLASEPSFEKAWWTAFGVANEQGQFEEVAKLMAAYNQQFGTKLTKEDLDQEEYAAFLRSPEAVELFH